MSFDLAIFRGRAADLEDETRMAALDPEVVREVLGSARGAEVGDERIAIDSDALFVDVLLVVDDEGICRAVEAGVTFNEAPLEQTRRELGALLELFVEVADRVGARLYQDGRFLGRRAARMLAESVGRAGEGAAEHGEHDAVDSFGALYSGDRRWGAGPYRLHVLRGDPELGDEATFWPLDTAAVRRFLDSHEHVQRIGEGVVWSDDDFVAEIFPSEDGEGEVRSLAFGLFDSQPGAEVDEAGLRELLRAVFSLAAELSARVWDEQWERFVVGEDVDELVRVLV